MTRFAAAVVAATLVAVGCGDGDDTKRIVGIPTTTTVDPVVVELRAVRDDIASLRQDQVTSDIDQKNIKAELEQVKRLYVERASRSATATRASTAARPAATGDVWWRLALCESGGRQDAYNPAGPFYSYFQWLLSTWRSVGGTGDPRGASYDTQKALAQKLQARSGWSQWPACSRKLGLR